VENIKLFDSPDLNALVDKVSPFLAEVKKRTLVTILAFALATISGFFFYEEIIRFLIRALSLEGINIVFTSPFQFINLAISCGIATGLVFSFPFLISQILFFLKPALKIREYRMISKFVPFSMILFLIGFLFGTFIMKWQIDIFLETSQSLGIGNILDITRLLSTVLLTSAFMGAGFQFPIVILLLLRLGIIKPKEIAKKRSWIYLGSFIFAILLPADSILADIVLALPLIILFELTLILNRVSITSKR
jgi:sec-independent protein translocase protein TatC